MPRVVGTGGGVVGGSTTGHEFVERGFAGLLDVEWMNGIVFCRNSAGPIANGHVIPDDDPLFHQSRFLVARQP
jgi:hypothetical protein